MKKHKKRQRFPNTISLRRSLQGLDTKAWGVRKKTRCRPVMPLLENPTTFTGYRCECDIGKAQLEFSIYLPQKSERVHRSETLLTIKLCTSSRLGRPRV